jgi:hypothetical protein
VGPDILDMFVCVLKPCQIRLGRREEDEKKWEEGEGGEGGGGGKEGGGKDWEEELGEKRKERSH